MSLPKVRGFFARGPNPRWPPAPSWKIIFRTRAPTIMYEYTFPSKSTTRNPILTSVWRYNINLIKIQDGRQRHLEKMNFWTRALRIMYEYTFSSKSTTRNPILRSVWRYNIILIQYPRWPPSAGVKTQLLNVRKDVWSWVCLWFSSFICMSVHFIKGNNWKHVNNNKLPGILWIWYVLAQITEYM